MQALLKTLNAARQYLARLAVIALTSSALSGTPLVLADEQPATAPLGGEHLTVDPEKVTQPWTGDLDGMSQRRVIRILTVYSKTFYFMDQGVQRGAAYEMGRALENELNKKLAGSAAKGAKHLKVQVVFIPVGRDELVEALVSGRGDIAMANLTVTDGRRNLVDFSSPLIPNVTELLVSGPNSPDITRVDDLAGKTVYVRKSSSYYESLLERNVRFASNDWPAVIIKETPEELESEDLIEMVSAGLIPLTVVDKHVADFWKQVFSNITVHDDVVLKTGGEVAWAFRKDSPQLKAALASYNAGAGRMSQMRKEAGKRGLDPNIWFHNVEYVAADRIGAKTVNYVANIFKYYIAYHMLLEAQQEREQVKKDMQDRS